VSRKPAQPPPHGPERLHFIPEWAAHRGMNQVELAEAAGVNKSTAKRWFDGAIPKAENIASLLGALGLEEPEDLFRHPNDDWLARFFRQRTEEERDRARILLETAFPKRVA
jgi:transcriptional regulator with XRE-family HTH domain